LAINEATNNASLLQLRSTVSTAPLRRAQRRGGGYLSYDTQVKLGFYSGASPLPDDPIGIIPSSVAPAAAGLTFRLNNIVADTVFNGYGLSFMRADGTSLPAAVFSNIVPTGMDDQPLIVLWQQTSAGPTWLAYKKMQPYIYPIPPDVFDDVLGTWIPNNGFWQLDNTGGRNASPAWHYVDDSTNATRLETPPISLNNPAPLNPMCDGAPIITLSFWCRELIELSRSTFRDALISYNGGAFSQFAPTLRREENGWYLYTYDLSSHAGQSIRMQFAVAPSPGPRVQWDIDDVQILYETCPWPVRDSTLMVRLREAAVVQFDNGQPREIRQGDWIYGETSGTRARVLQPPIVTSGDWSTSSPAAGTLLLDNLSVNPAGFQTNENLLVVGATGGGGARVVSYDNVTDRKVNVIKVFYASAAGSGAASNDPLDPDTLPYPRREATAPYRWPPDENEVWEATQDYYRLVQWDGINSVAGLSYIAGSGDTVIRSYDPDLQSPPLSQQVFTELGLHAYGDGADNVYFDDFGLRLFLGTSSLFDTVLQQ
jgi:hypothetical protein